MIPQDLLEFRFALTKLQTLEVSSDRRKHTRYAPSGWLTTAKVRFASADEQLHDADVVDLSSSGIRLALPPGTSFGEGDRCQIILAPNASTTWVLDGEIRWVTLHPYITVFGVLLDPDNSPIQAI